MILLRGMVPQQKRLSIVNGDQDVEGAVVIEVSNRQASCGVVLGKGLTCSFAKTYEFLTIIVKQQQRLFVLHVSGVFFDLVIGMAVAADALLRFPREAR